MILFIAFAAILAITFGIMALFMSSSQEPENCCKRDSCHSCHRDPTRLGRGPS